MAEKFDQISMEQIAALAASPAGQQLMKLIQRSGGQELGQAAAKASAGDLAGAKELLAPMLADPRIRALMEQLGGR